MPALEFTTWNAVVTGTEVWSETHVSGHIDPVSINTTTPGYVSGSGGGGHISSTTITRRRIYFRMPDGRESHLVCGDHFGVIPGHALVIQGCKRSSEKADLYYYYHVHNSNTGMDETLMDGAGMIKRGRPSFGFVVFYMITCGIGWYLETHTRRADLLAQIGSLVFLLSIVMIVVQMVRVYRYRSERRDYDSQMAEHVRVALHG